MFYSLNLSPLQEQSNNQNNQLNLIISEYDWRVVHLKELILIHEMGGGEDFSVERAEKEIQENITRLKVLIEEYNQPSPRVK
ncbi:MAG: hypothetical protein FWG67_01155 [Defluviitaleaceae bacterium]|nr:hypothetical protein [Defluviitaleaceae bacterium]